jgi:hypothetical protein
LMVLALAGFLAGCALSGTPGAVAPSASRSVSTALAPSLNSASSFAVLGGPAVTLTDSVVNGDVGYVGAYTNTRSVVNGAVSQIDTTATPNAYGDFVDAYDAMRASLDLTTSTALSGTLASVTLRPGVYTFDAAATVTGVLTLDAQGDSNAQWTFFVGIGGTGALTGTGFTVVMANGGSPCNVSWWVAEAATMTSSNFQGTILAGAAITVTGGTFNGNALAQAAVTLTGVNLSGCTTPHVTVPPVQLGMKVTGGGQIAVDSGAATFGFNARPDKSGSGASGNFNYVNHVTGLHINGKVDYIAVSKVNPDGSPLTVLFSGTYAGGVFIATVQDQGEPGVNDQLGVIIRGSQAEVEGMNVISNGNIQFHK